MLNLLLVASGGAVGALLRFATSIFFKSYSINSYYSTLSVNLLGSFLIGYLVSLSLVKNLSDDFIKYFLIIGLLGSFTTFSAFSIEVVELFLSKKYLLTFLYIISSLVICIVAAYIGIYINKT